jgi:hypothetical protein
VNAEKHTQCRECERERDGNELYYVDDKNESIDDVVTVKTTTKSLFLISS